MKGYVKGGMIALIFAGLFGCQSGNPIMRSFENGTEIVENPLKAPKDASPILTPHIEISQQRSDLVQYGMRSMGEFVVDDEGDIYIVGYKNEKDHFYKLDASGEFVLSFGASGQGPGELEMPHALCITDSDFNEIKRLDTYKSYFGGDKYPPFFMWSITKDRIFA